MSRTRLERCLRPAFWIALTATLAVTGFGIHLTMTQYNDMEGILLEAEKRAARSLVARLAERLDAEERNALEELATAAAPEEIQAILSRAGYLGRPFLIESGGTLRLPVGRSRWGAVPASAVLEPLPEALERALEFAASPAPLAERLQHLESVYRSPQLAASWRLRARSAQAALLSREGRVEEAVRLYAEIFKEFEPLLARAAPNLLQLSLARARSLRRAGREGEAAEVLEEALEQAAQPGFPAGLDELAFFVAEAAALLGEERAARIPRLRELEDALAAERFDKAVISTLAGWIRLELRGRPAAELRPRHISVRFAGKLVPAVWTPVPQPPSGAGVLAAGFLLDPEKLCAHLESDLPEGVQGEPLRILLVSDGTEATHVVLATFPAGLEALAAGLERETWNRVVGRARRPFLFAGIFTIVLGFSIAASLVLLVRGVRRQLALSRMQTEFVAGVSHELKTPLALIRLAAETLKLRRAPSPEHEARYHEIILRESDRLGRLIGNVLNFARIEVGRAAERLEPCDPGRIVRDTLEEYAVRLEEAGFTCEVKVASGLPRVRADREAITQALLNLLDNALKYSPEEKHIEVLAESTGREVRISVCDRGIGIGPEDRRRIWEDYYRSAEARRLGTRGSGLGLSVVRRVVEAHGGRVELESEPGRGSRFTIVLAALSNPETPGEREERHA